MKPAKITSITTKTKKKQQPQKKQPTKKPAPQRKPITAPLPSFLRKKYIADEQVEEYTSIPKRKLAFWRNWHMEGGPPYKVFRHHPLYEIHALENWIAGLPAGGDPTHHVRWALENLSGLPSATMAETAKQVVAWDADTLEVAIKARANLDVLIAELQKVQP